MPAQAIDQNTLLSQEDLRSMAECTGPCISIYLPLKHSAMDRTLLKAAVHRAHTELAGHHLESGEVDRLLDPLRRLADELAETTAKTLSIFRSAEVFRIIPLS